MMDGGLAALWDCLRRHGLQSLAPTLVASRVSSLTDLRARVAELRMAGIPAWQLDCLLSEPGQDSSVPPTPASRGRRDIPVPAERGRASMALALEAASANNRKRALECLDEGILSANTRPAVDSRVRMYEEICQAWGVASWPITHDSLRCFAASLKHGRYRSAALYFSSVFGHQTRTLVQPVDELLKVSAKNFTRSITRGMGPSQLKDSFDVAELVRIPLIAEVAPFQVDKPDHGRDISIVSSWFMLRELELASARFHHLYLQNDMVHLLIPLHKTDQSGHLTLRSLRCACKVRRHPLCPFHAAERHLVRVSAHLHFKSQPDFPLVPSSSGSVLSKHDMVMMFRGVISAAGINTQRPDDLNVMVERFGGHVMRVSGAQFLSSQGIPLSTIQLLGRWTSNAIDRYLQSAPLLQLPQVAPLALHGVCPPPVVVDVDAIGDDTVVAIPDEPCPPSPEVPLAPAAGHAEVEDLRAQVDRLKGSLAAITETMQTPAPVLVHRKSSRVVHSGATDEKENAPGEWRTNCGWAYGFSNFFRVPSLQPGFRKCKKCFRDAEDCASQSDASRSSSDSSSSSS